MLKIAAEIYFNVFFIILEFKVQTEGECSWL